MSIVETFHGYIETTQDTLLIFEACRRGLLPRICRRLQEKERRIVQSGTVFIFDERESGIKRWTDGLVWSPSRILGNFLIYRELDKRHGSKKDNSPIEQMSRSGSSDNESAIEKNKERALVGSLTNSYRFKKNGLIKKTMSIVVNGVSQHMISYYSKEDVLAGKLRTPSSVPELASLEISPEFLVKQNFRIPPTVEQSYDHHTIVADHLQSPISSHSPRTPSGSFTHTMGPNGAEYSSTGFSHQSRARPESNLAGPSQLYVFPKPYYQHTHHPLYPQHGYDTMAHLSGTPPEQQQHQQQQHDHQHHTPHPYSPHQTTFPPNFGYNSETVPNVAATTPPLRYLPRNAQGLSPYQSNSPHQSQYQQHEQDSHDDQQQQQHHGQQYYEHHSHEQEPLDPKQEHDQHPQSAYNHAQLPPTTQGWNDFGYSSYSSSSTAFAPTSVSGHHSEHHSQPDDEHDASP
ncbi:hypothetical protein BGZ51_003166 [Haplosporangium sp. Z 767]|nr:hypothetical protein BGZ51_003166 [Haplosporangium sp. Z 767]